MLKLVYYNFIRLQPTVKVYYIVFLFLSGAEGPPRAGKLAVCPLLVVVPSQSVLPLAPVCLSPSECECCVEWNWMSGVISGHSLSS